MSKMLRVLMIENSETGIKHYISILKEGGFDVTCSSVITVVEMVDALNVQRPDIIICNLHISGFSVDDALHQLKSQPVKIPFVVISQKCDEAIIVRLIKAGVADFITTENLPRLVSVVEHEITFPRLWLRKLSREINDTEFEGKCRNLVDSITDIFFALDTNLCCIYWNKAAEKQTGISLKNALTRPFRELFPDIPLIEVEERIKKVLDCKIADSFCCDSHTNNRYSYYEISIYPFLKGVTLLFRHMSEYRSTEELQKTQEEIKKQLAQSQEYRILGQLTSGVAHEVRNPLNAISVVMEALFLDLGDNPDFLPYKEHIFTHVDRLKRLMQDLLELGKPIERSKVVTLHLDDLIRESISLWKSSGPHDSFNVLLDVSHDEELKIKGDPLKLQQVFLNILDNASQHSAKGSTIKVSFFKENDFCTVTIVDQGSGLNADYFKHMFEPFFTTRKKGTGLGLAIVKHIVEVHGGTIAIANSESGSGCTVIIRLPLNQKIGKAQKMCACIGK